ncbi:MAG: sugar transferase [Verrucomicrobiales bacterium]|jgi:lipopolysaccharide/colanic/teichoic acid biosynthesis glycosyltransferase|nr:sugar transferase [Verrucomicrobiales bacterium]
MSNWTQLDVELNNKFSKLIGRKLVAAGQNGQVQRGTTESTEAGLPLWKRVLDVTAILVTLPVTLTVCIPLAIFIKVVSPGPIFFRQERVGFRCKTFRLLKFRSMHCGADTAVHDKHLKQLMGAEKPMQKMDGNDSRLIPLGKWIRASGLDELPQLLNVLRGEMSLVGPRPCTTFEFANYETWQKERFNATPGLTGLWQVCGKNRTTFRQMVQMDIAYGKHKCLSLDLSIIVRTIPALVVQLLAARAAAKQTRMGSNGDAELAKAKSITENEDSAEGRSGRVRVLGA